MQSYNHSISNNIYDANIGMEFNKSYMSSTVDKATLRI